MARRNPRRRTVVEKNSVDLSDPLSIVGTRVFDAPRELVFSAFTDPKHLAQWWGPEGFTTTTNFHAFRAGGIWRFVMHGPDGRDFQNLITYDEIVPPERIVYRHGGSEEIEPVRFKTTVIFADLDGGKTKLIWRGQFPSAAERDRVIREYGADKGLVQTMARLAIHVAAQVQKDATNEFGDGTVNITRVFEAPRALVWKAWTDPKMMAEWFGPRHFTNPVCELDVRPGGKLRIVMRGPDGMDYPCAGEFREVVKPERLVFTNNAVDKNGKLLLEGFTTVTFAEERGKTTVKLKTHAVGRVPVAKQMLAGMEAGWTQSIDKLEELVVGAA
jgi:uncharacterized protein YndB with AHSA1/START domain